MRHHASPPHASSWRLFGLVALGTLAAGGTTLAMRMEWRPPAHAPTWTEARWDRPLDNWGTGRTWRATTEDGSAVRLFARTKTGFCNCFNGIADDAEIDRIGDVDLHGDDFAPLAPGRTAAIGALPGRARDFQAARRWNGASHVVSIVVASDCKAVVATLVSSRAISPVVEASAVSLLADASFRRWADDQ